MWSENCFASSRRLTMSVLCYDIHELSVQHSFPFFFFLFSFINDSSDFTLNRSFVSLGNSLFFCLFVLCLCSSCKEANCKKLTYHLMEKIMYLFSFNYASHEALNSWRFCKSLSNSWTNHLMTGEDTPTESPMDNMSAEKQVVKCSKDLINSASVF